MCSSQPPTPSAPSAAGTEEVAVERWSVGQLRAEAKRLGASLGGCVEKSDMVAAVRAARAAAWARASARAQ
eukprot:gene49450-9333_t